MLVTRRTLVRNLTALSALPLVSGLDSGCHSTSTGDTQAPKVTPGTPNPSSLFVLFQGPWIFDQLANVASPTLRVRTFGHLHAPWSASHHCPVGLGTPGKSDLSPIPSQSPSLPLNLDAGDSWSLTPATGYSAPKTTFKGIFDAAHQKDPLVYVTGANMTVLPHKNDRVVTLPMPDAVYVGAYLKGVTVTVPDLSAGTTSTSNSYVVVILEYQNASSPALTLTSSGQTRGISTNQQLVFRMIHSDQMTPLQHVHAAHETLRRRIGNWDTTTGGTGDGTELGLILNTSVTGTGDFTAVLSNDRAGFDQLEMGLTPQPPMHGGTTYGDCCGGGIVLGG